MNYKFSRRSLTALDGVAIELRVLAKEVLKVSDIDFAVTEGYRTEGRQAELYRRGRDGKGGKIVTYKDGVYTRSKHQDRKAIDIVPYVDSKYDWNNLEAFRYIRRLFTEKARELKIKITLLKEWDMPHIELEK